MKTKRSIRLEKKTVELLRDLRDSFITPVAIPELVRRCLKQTDGVVCDQNQPPTTRKNSEVITIWLSDEHANLDHAEIVARIKTALVGIEEKLVPAQIEWNRKPKTGFIIES